MSWESWQGDAQAWDALLLRFPDHSTSQGHGWGEHKRDSRWIPIRMTAHENGRTSAMAQVLIRCFPLGVALAWVPGGPVGDVTAWGEPFRAAIKRVGGVRHLYCRINPMREFLEAESATLRAMAWNRPRDPMLSGASILLDLTVGDEEWLNSIDGKHRYYIRKSARAAPDWAFGNSDVLRRDLVTLTRQLSEDKGMDLQERDAESMESLSRAMPGAMQILIGYAGSEPITGCLVLIQGVKAFYATAATVGPGRKVSAAYCMFSRLRSLLREQKIHTLDFGGIYPRSGRTQGVDHFKRGFGGREIRYLGEWDWATSSPLRRVANYFIKRRTRRM